jgi:hypothetical protein
MDAGGASVTCVPLLAADCAALGHQETLLAVKAATGNSEQCFVV